MNFSIGTDPEIILTDIDYTPKSSIGILKHKNKAVQGGENKIYYDNVLAEVNTTPSFPKEEFLKNIKYSLNSLVKLIKPLKISKDSFAVFPSSELNHKDAFEFGCEREYCAYDLDAHQMSFMLGNARFAGGHVHIGIDIKNQEEQVMLVRMLDLFLGLSLISIDDSKNCCKRRSYFGKFGRYRKTSYGIEYRTPSNFWLFYQSSIELVYDIVEFVIDFVKKEKHFNFWKIDYDKLNSDEFWNNGGDPSTCHDCFGYDANFLKKITKKEELELNSDIIQIINLNMPKKILRKIEEIKDNKTSWDFI